MPTLVAPAATLPVSSIHREENYSEVDMEHLERLMWVAIIIAALVLVLGNQHHTPSFAHIVLYDNGLAEELQHGYSK